MTIVFGIDPGSTYTGFGVLQKKGSRIVHIDSGRICAGKSGKVDFATRLLVIFRDLELLLDQHRPDLIAIEQVFSHVNVSSALKLGQARGVALCACERYRSGIVHEFSPKAIKKTVTGYGAAKKEQMQYMICQLLGLKCSISEDAADALAIAMTCAHVVMPSMERIE